MGTAAEPAPVSELADYTRPLRRRWRWIAIGTALGFVLGLAAAALVHHGYTSTASVAVTPTDVQQDVNNVNGRTQDVINLDTEAQLVKSDAVAARVRRVLQGRAPLATIERRVSVTVPPNTTVLRISYTGTSPRGAVAGAQAYATSYLSVRALTATRLLRSQVAAVRKQMSAVAEELALQKAPAVTASERSLRAVRYRALATESTALAKQLSILTTKVVTPGSVIAGATTPSGNGGRWLLFLLSGTMLGFLAGVGCAVVRDRTDTRIRELRDLEDAGIRVFGALDTPSNAMRTYARAGNAVLGAQSGRGGVAVVVGPAWEPHNSDVALNVASAMRDVAGNVALVTVEHGSARMTLLGAEGEGGAGGRAAGSKKKPSGSSAASTRSGPRQTVESLKKDVDVVVVDAVDPLAEAVLPACDTALLVVSMNETPVPEVVEAVEEMEREGVRVLGAVVLPGRGGFAFGRWPLDSVSRGTGGANGGSALPAHEGTSSRA